MFGAVLHQDVMTYAGLVAEARRILERALTWSGEDRPGLELIASR